MLSRINAIGFLLVHWGIGIVIGSGLESNRFTHVAWIGIGMYILGQFIATYNKYQNKK